VLARKAEYTALSSPPPIPTAPRAMHTVRKSLAERVGYGEPTNFTAAFRRHFAFLPREARVQTRSPGETLL
jgi:hypothetical protein